MGLLNPRQDLGFRTSRGMVVVAIVALHVTAIAVGLAMKGPVADRETDASPILVSLLTENHTVESPQMRVRMEEVLPAAVAPVVRIDIQMEPATTITLASRAPVPVSAAASPPTETGDAPVSVSQPDYLRRPRAAYPPAAKRARAQGLVHVRALVDTDGHAREVSVARSSGFELLDRAACDAVMQAEFMPYRHNNVPRSMVVIVPIEFSLTPRQVADRGRRGNSELDVRGEHHHAMGRHAEELGSLGAAALHVGEQPELQISE